MRVQGITLGHRGHVVISQVEDSVALVRSSEEDVYYRIDSMTVEIERKRSANHVPKNCV